MDLLQRAADLLDRAQDHVAQAGNQAVRIVESAAQVKALEAIQSDLRAQLERAVADLGRLSFQRWKCGGVGNDSEMVAAYHRVDQLNSSYQHVLQDLISARAAVPLAGGDPLLPPAAPPYPDAGLSNGPYATGPTHYATPVLPFPAGSGPVAPLPPPRMPRQASECPECYTLVPGNVDFCPSCGMRV
jgi:hypothetical protein